MQSEDFSKLRLFISQLVQITEEDWSLHRDALSIRRLRKGEFLLTEGEICRYVSFINTGSFRSFALIKGQEVTNYFYFENEYTVDYTSFLTQSPSTKSLQALENSEVLQIHYHDLQRIYEISPVWQKYGRLMAEKIYLRVTKREKDLLYFSPEELYINLMRERPDVIEKVSQQYIASYLGIKPESLSRIRKRLMETKKE